jgi:hypothetical protein
MRELPLASNVHVGDGVVLSAAWARFLIRAALNR